MLGDRNFIEKIQGQEEQLSLPKGIRAYVNRWNPGEPLFAIADMTDYQ